MLRFLQRHPLPIAAWFDFSLVLTYAFPQALLRPLLPAGLALDTHGDVGFVAVALVQVRQLRPAGLPAWLGQNFFLSGYRIFTRYTSSRGKRLRGLYILRGDTDSRLMARFGHLTTHYGFAHAAVQLHETPAALDLRISTRSHRTDLALTADLAHAPALPPPGSPFADWREARRFAGPLPFTFSPDAAAGAMLLVEGRRENWTPQPVAVQVHEVAFFQQPPFNQVPLQLANAFLIRNIPYQWQAGVLDPLTDS